jgi:predicted permease
MLWQNLKYAAGTLRRNPVYAATVILSLALGIGANSTIFAALDMFLFRSLPVNQPEQLVQIASANTVVIGTYYGRSVDNTYSYPLYQDLRTRNQVFSGLICRGSQLANMSYRGNAERVEVEFVSDNYFDMLGIPPALGRTISSQDDGYALTQPAAVLSYDYWKRHLGADPAVLNETLLLSGRTLTVVGVAGQRFHGLELGHSPAIYVPVRMGDFQFGAGALTNRRHIWLQIIGRLREGITLEQAQTALNPVFHRILENETREMGPEISDQTRQQYLRQSLNMQSGRHGVDYLQKRGRPYLAMLSAIVIGVLLIACANAAAIQLAQAVRRRKEIALRMSLGASRGRLIRLLLTESFLLALLGGAVSVIVTWWMLDGLRELVSIFQPLEEPMTLNLRVFSFTALLSLGAALLFGLTPAFHALRVDILPMLRDEGTVLASSTHTAARRILVVGQIALSMLLLAGAGLFIRSLLNLQKINPGFEHHNLLKVQINPITNHYSPERTRTLADGLLERVKVLPGVKQAIMSSHGILMSSFWSDITVEGHKTREGESVWSGWNSVSPGFFKFLGIPILGGRDFSDLDTQNSPLVAIVNESFARTFFSNRNPIGKHLQFGGNPQGSKQLEIVGVIRDAAFVDLREKKTPFFFVCLTQTKIELATLLVRMDKDPQKIVQAIRREMFALDPALPLWEIQTLDAQIKEQMGPERLFAILTGIFGAIAMALAAAGLFGLLSFLVAQRTREIGVRMALGAEQSGIVWTVLKQTLMLTGIGLFIGLGATFLLSRYLKSMLFEVQPVDPSSLALTALFIVIVTLIAAFIPARRAAATDPMEALRHE